MKLSLQGKDQGDHYLDEAIHASLAGASAGGAAFAFASKRGIDALFGSDGFKAFLETGTFELVVGVGAITNTKAITRLKELVASSGGHLVVKVFLSNVGEPLFHPKFCWFTTDVDATVIVGSGNLTLGGLRNNWEAFGKAEGVGRATVLDAWNAWLRQTPNRLVNLDHEEVTKRAKANEKVAKATKKLREEILEAEGVAVEAAQKIKELVDGDIVLLAEVPKGGTRWKQAGFDKWHFENYFGAKLGAGTLVHLTHVRDDGSEGELEVRPGVSVASRNYRFELDGAAGLDYPADGRPIGVFLRFARRQFAYMLALPGTKNHEIASALLDKYFGPAARDMRRKVISLDALSHDWPDCPLLKMDIEAIAGTE